MELSSGIRKLLSGVKTNKSTPFNLNSMPYHCYQDVSNLQCYQNDFSKLEELTRVLANMDAINGKLVDTISNSTIFDEQIKHDMCTFKSLARAFIGSPPVQHKMKHVLVSTMGTQNEPFSPFSQAREREPIVIDNLAKVSNFLDVSTQQRKVVRFKVCPQATQHRILIGTLKEVLNNFKVDLDALDSQGLDKDTIMGQQIVLTCLKFLTEAAVSNEPESNSWMRLSPSNNVNTSGSRKWEDVLEMFNDLIEYFRAETRLKLHVAKAEVMKEGLLQIKDILIDNSIGYKEARHQERLVQKKLSKTLGHSSRCLFTLLLYYLFGRVSDIEVDMAGGVYESVSDNKNWLCMGRILTSDSEKMIGRGVKQLDRALSLFKFVWETAEMKGHLDLQGHLWCVGEHNRVLRFWNKAILHDILARLPDRDSARTSVLSKAWRETWSTFPILSICSDQHFKSQDVTVDNYHSKIDKVIDYVGRRLLRLRDLGLAIKEFKLIMDYVDYKCMAHHVDLWMKMAIESGGEVLHLQLRLPGRYVGRHSSDRFYDLPLSVIESKSLTKLVLMDRIRVGQAFLTHSIKLYSVRILKLCNIFFGHEGIIDHLISHCPLIEDLTVIDCAVYNPPIRGTPQVYEFSLVEFLFLHGLHKLKKVYVQGMREVYIDAPNLESLHCCLQYLNTYFKLNLDSCTNLRWLCLWNLKNIAIGDKWFLELFSKFPFLESLELDNCSMSKRINISSAQLKVLKLSYCSNLEELNIDARNLLSFAYEGNNQPGISFQKCSNQLEVNSFSDVDFRDLCSLRKFVQNIKPQKIWASVSLFICLSILTEPEQVAARTLFHLVFALMFMVKHSFRMDSRKRKQRQEEPDSDSESESEQSDESEESSPAEKEKEKKKTKTTPKKTQPKKKKVLVEDSPPKEDQYFDGVPIQVFVPASQTTTETDFEPTSMLQIEGTTETTPETPKQLQETTPTVPPAPTKVHPDAEDAAALLMMARTASYVPKTDPGVPSFSLGLTDSSQEGASTQETEREKSPEAANLIEQLDSLVQRIASSATKGKNTSPQIQRETGGESSAKFETPRGLYQITDDMKQKCYIWGTRLKEDADGNTNEYEEMCTLIGQGEYILMRMHLASLQAKSDIESQIVSAICLILNNKNEKRFQEQIYCLPPDIVCMALLDHPNGEFVSPKTKKEFRVEAYPSFIPFIDRKKLTSHPYIFSPVCYAGHWWLWLINTRKRKCQILDPLHKIAPTDERKTINKFTGYVFSRLITYAGGGPLQKGEREKEIKSPYVKISGQKTRLQLLSSPHNTNYSDKVGIVDDILGHGSSPPHARRVPAHLAGSSAFSPPCKHKEKDCHSAASFSVSHSSLLIGRLPKFLYFCWK
ncbi:hypothetical protein Ahy_B09g095149 isoform B [Arachis hypogaea]|uniref:Uncharacterized protein n=1 Tax=Arachis hypogaea TaxID=3818 RepID=A0A444XDE3_ARAHY|nr:hypothetical protein Ahy_B09g095149 isoform B [Arachis hypogaea]